MAKYTPRNLLSLSLVCCAFYIYLLKNGLLGSGKSMRFNGIKLIVLFGAASAVLSIKDSSEAYIGQHQIPVSLTSLSKNSGGTITLSRRISSVRPGNPIRVSFTLDSWDPLSSVELIAAAYSAQDGSLVQVLGRLSALPPPERGVQSMHSLVVHLPIEGLSPSNKLSVYRLALIAPHATLAGEWSRYSAGTMLFCV